MIINRTKEKIISGKEIICKTIFSHVRGLMFRKKKCNLVMVFPQERKISLHTFFVFYPIDVLVLDKERKVMEIKKSFTPYSFWTAQQKGKYVVELAESEEYEVGNVLEIMNEKF